MIKSIRIQDVATFTSSPQEMDELSLINFIYGSNGTGKTAISRILDNESLYPRCNVQWKANTALDTLVYNTDFIESNFAQTDSLPGIFTLGEENIESKERIAEINGELEDLTNEIQSLSGNLRSDDGDSGKEVELETLEEDFKGIAWQQKRIHDSVFAAAFEGLRNSSDKFKRRVLQEDETNSASTVALSDLKSKAETIFGETLVSENQIPNVSLNQLTSIEAREILEKVVVGKSDVNLSQLIERLQNSDWVRQGTRYLESSEGVCPYCQQSLPQEFSKEIGDYFDEAFENDSNEIDSAYSDCQTESQRVVAAIDGVLEIETNFLDKAALLREKELLEKVIAINLARLDEKKKEKGRKIQLDKHENISEAVSKIIKEANNKIKEHNDLISNLANERRTLKAQIWRYILDEELKTDLANYKKKKEALNKAINGIGRKVQEKKSKRKELQKELRGLERETTSVKPTIDAINGLLEAFGFKNFSLAQAADNSNYKLVRPDGSNVVQSLSEGEKTFVTFLYFYHLLLGSNNSEGVKTNRVAVFDDPISSLDSEILFIVSSLIKKVFERCRDEEDGLKQVFVLTHNVYFFKEVSFNMKRGDAALNEETFWIVTKTKNVSKVVGHETNPIKTSYELLWSDVRNHNQSTFTIQNTLRRILENYFKILGGIDHDELCEKFEGNEKLICRGLFSWVNAGSHWANDDLYTTIGEEEVEKYLEVFKKIFEKSGHKAHYDMMMTG